MAKMTLIVPFCLVIGSGMFVDHRPVEGEPNYEQERV